MKHIITIALITGLTGCQIYSPLTADKLSDLSSEDLCRALGTYNNNGGLVLKIYDELNKRPEKINTERCYALERLNGNPQGMELNVENNFHQQSYARTSTIEHKGEKIVLLDDYRINPIYTNRMKYKSESDKNKEKTYTKQEEEMGKIMRSCLKKHLSHPRVDVDTNK